MISKPRRGLFRASESPLSDAAACCCQQRGWSCGWAVRQRGRRGRAHPAFMDAERSDAVDGVRHQFSRARPDLGLCRAQLPQAGSRPLLDRFGVCRRNRRKRCRRRAASSAGSWLCSAGGAIILFAIWLAAMGVQRFYGRPVAWRSAALLTATTLAVLAFFTFVHESVLMRVLVYSLAEATPLVLVDQAAAFLQGRPRPSGRPACRYRRGADPR